MKNPKILIIAGEASGDSRGAELIRAIRHKAPDAIFFGIGGDQMAEAGMTLSRHVSEMAFLGFFEVIRHLPFIWGVFGEMKRLIDEQNPDLVVLVDYPGFNLRFAKSARKKGFPVVYYISPQIWAWGRRRVRKIRKYVDHMIVILPFEESFYRNAGIPVSFVGHPLKDSFHVDVTREDFLRPLNIDPGQKVIGLLPGSRKQEVESLLPEMVAAARLLQSRHSGLKCLVGKSPTLLDEVYTPAMMGTGIQGLREQTHALMQHCDALLVASGTATLEAAIAGTPMVVVYKMSPLSYWIGRRIVRLTQIGLVNIVAGTSLAPELIQSRANANDMAEALWPLLMDEKIIASTREGFKQVSEKLGEPGAASRSADVIFKVLDDSTP